MFFTAKSVWLSSDDWTDFLSAKLFHFSLTFGRKKFGMKTYVKFSTFTPTCKFHSFSFSPALRLPPLRLLPSSASLRRWISDEWEHCPRTCGSLGFQIRTVRCVQFLHDGTNRSVHSKYCSGEKPESRRACNRVACPAPWRTGAWSEVCTSSCL